VIRGSDKENAMEDELLHHDVTEAIIGAAMRVHNELKPGLDEKFYENALVIELCNRGHVLDQQSRFPVYYEGELIGTMIPDLIVDGKVIADPKVVTEFNETHIAKMIGYLAITKLRVAILLNFKHARLTWKRIVR
jgi:GxxExxY protein